MKKVSVIIPVYGAEKYIVKAVKSVLNQTYQNFELLIIDDGSPDRSIEICRQFLDPRIKILSQENRGIASARNLGIRHATGEYIALLDADDFWTPDKLIKHVKHLENSPWVGVSFCRSALIDENDTPLGIYQFTKLTNITLLDLLCRTPIGNGSVPVIRRAVLDDIQFLISTDQGTEVCYFNPDLKLQASEDVECWLRIALHPYWKIEGIPDALTCYRVNSKGLSANLLKKLQSWKQMLQEARTYGGQKITLYEAPALSYQLRHLARRAVTLREGVMAVDLMHQSFTTYAWILLEEPFRTVQTLAAVYLVNFVPLNLYGQFETSVMRMWGFLQRQKLLREVRQSNITNVT